MTEEKIETAVPSENKPDGTKQYVIDGVKATVNFFFSKNGVTVEKALEKYIATQVGKQLVTSLRT